MEHLTGAHEHQGEPLGSRVSACGRCEIFHDLLMRLCNSEILGLVVQKD